MKREQKTAVIEELTSSIGAAGAIFAVDYRGISVGQAAELRGRLREADAVFKVVKNRLAKRATADAGAEAIDEYLIGPTALTLVHGDAVVAAKAISTFSREHGVLEFKGGLMDGELLDSEGFAVIARLPGVDVLRGQLVGVAASPITGLVRGLGSMISGLAIALGQIAEQGLVSGEAAPAAGSEDAPAEAEEADAASEPEAAADAPSDDAASEPEPEADAPSDDAATPDANAPTEGKAGEDAPEAAAEPEAGEAGGEGEAEISEQQGDEKSPDESDDENAEAPAEASEEE